MRKFKKVSYNDTGILPTRSDLGSAGYDFYTPVDLVIEPGKVVKFETNIKAKMLEDEVLKLYVRSSIGIKKNLMLCNGTGIIDSTYYNNPDNEGNIIVALYNYGDNVQSIKAGDRVIQGVFMKYLITEDDSPINAKRLGGIGSSGK
jgi:dUTP pyrophosphatase